MAKTETAKIETDGELRRETKATNTRKKMGEYEDHHCPTNTNKQTRNQENKITNKKISQQTNKQRSKQVNKQTDR